MHDEQTKLGSYRRQPIPLELTLLGVSEWLIAEPSVSGTSARARNGWPFRTNQAASEQSEGCQAQPGLSKRVRTPEGTQESNKPMMKALC